LILYGFRASWSVTAALASLPRQVRQALTEFMDAVIIVDPLEYQR